MHFFIFPSYLFRSAVSELVTRLRRFLCRCGGVWRKNVWFSTHLCYTVARNLCGGDL